MTARKVPPTHPGVVLAEALDAMGLKTVNPVWVMRS